MSKTSCFVFVVQRRKFNLSKELFHRKTYWEWTKLSGFIESLCYATNLIFGCRTSRNETEHIRSMNNLIFLWRATYLTEKFEIIEFGKKYLEKLLMYFELFGTFKVTNDLMPIPIPRASVTKQRPSWWRQN